MNCGEENCWTIEKIDQALSTNVYLWERHGLQDTLDEIDLWLDLRLEVSKRDDPCYTNCLTTIPGAIPR